MATVAEITEYIQRVNNDMKDECDRNVIRMMELKKAIKHGGTENAVSNIAMAACRMLRENTDMDIVTKYTRVDVAMLWFMSLKSATAVDRDIVSGALTVLCLIEKAVTGQCDRRAPLSAAKNAKSAAVVALSRAYSRASRLNLVE